MTDLVSRTRNLNLVIFHFHFDIAIDRLFQFTFRALYRNVLSEPTVTVIPLGMTTGFFPILDIFLI